MTHLTVNSCSNDSFSYFKSCISAFDMYSHVIYNVSSCSFANLFASYKALLSYYLTCSSSKKFSKNIFNGKFYCCTCATNSCHFGVHVSDLSLSGAVIAHKINIPIRYNCLTVNCSSQTVSGQTRAYFVPV